MAQESDRVGNINTRILVGIAGKLPPPGFQVGLIDPWRAQVEIARAPACRIGPGRKISLSIVNDE